jgi:ABC-type dipeptide/oligopeptide/nickel transport system ATPase component
MITHDPATLAGLADRVLVLSAGKRVEEGSLAQVCTQPRHPYTQALLSAIPPLPPMNAGVREGKN